MCHSRFLGFAVILGLIGFLCSCGNGNSAATSAPPPTPQASTAPFITAISPATIVSSPTPQTIVASGGELTGASATLRYMPVGSPAQEFDNQPLETLDDTQVAISGTFLSPGLWSAEFKKGTLSSGQIPFQVQQSSGNGGNPADPYGYPLFDATPDSVDWWDFDARECTSYVAWAMNVIHGNRAKPWFFTNNMDGGHWGFATDWDANAQKLGYQIDTTPAIGAVAQWHFDEIHFANGQNVPGGHVAVVVAINGDGSVMVADYNFKTFAFDLHPERPHRFIHIVDTPGSPGSLNPAFLLKASPSAQVMHQGENATFSLQLSSENGFSGQVTWTAIGLPLGYAAGTSDQATTVTVPSGGSAQSTFRINTNSLTATGTFNVTLRAMSPGLPSSDFTVSVTILDQNQSVPRPIMSLSGNGQVGGNGSILIYTVPVNGNVLMNFDSSSSTAGTGSIVSVEWMSNGTVISTKQAFSLPFGTPSNTITLKVTNSAGLSATATATIVVQTSSPTSPQAVMSLSGNGQVGGNGSILIYTVPVNGNVLMNFDSSSSTAGTGSIVSVEWLSNGTVISTKQAFSLPFGTPSNTITLKVTNSAGLSATATATIIVQTSSPTSPQAVMSLSGNGQVGSNGSILIYTVPVNGNVLMNFDSSSSTAGTGSIVSVEWLSNGTVISTKQAFSLPFGTPSNTITLKVTNSAGLSATATATVIVQTSSPTSPQAVMSLSGNGQVGGNGSTLVYKVPVNGNVTVNFDSSSSTAGTGSIVSVEWLSNGTVISTKQAFSLPFGTPSNTITLKVTNSAGLTATATATVLITH